MINFVKEYTDLQADLSILREGTTGKRRDEINNLLTPVCQIIDDLIDPEGEDISITELCETLSEIRNRTLELIKNPDSAGKHDEHERVTHRP